MSAGESNKLSNIEAERRRLSSQRSKVSQRRISLVKDKITILIDDTSEEEQHDLSMMLPLVFQDDVEGYDLGALVDKAMEAYNLKSRFGVQVDYWANTFNAFFICDNLFSHRLSQTSKHSDNSLQQVRNISLNSNQNIVRHLVAQDDLIQKGDRKILNLRFKNCTGNIIVLNKETIKEVSPSEQLTAKIALSIDPEFKH